MPFISKEVCQHEINTNYDLLNYNLLKQLMTKQTPDELKSYQTRDDNGIGANKCDAKLFTFILYHFGEPMGSKTRVTADDMRLLRKRLPTYWKQLTPQDST